MELERSASPLGGLTSELHFRKGVRAVVRLDRPWARGSSDSDSRRSSMGLHILRSRRRVTWPKREGASQSEEAVGQQGVRCRWSWPSRQRAGRHLRWKSCRARFRGSANSIRASNFKCAICPLPHSWQLFSTAGWTLCLRSDPVSRFD